MQPTKNFRKLVNFGRSGQIDLEWLVSHGYGKTSTDAARRSVALTRRILEVVE